MNTIIDFIKRNLIVVGITLLFIVLAFFPKLFKARRVVRRRRVVKPVTRSRARSRSLPRSVGSQKLTGKGYPAAGGGYVPFKYNKDGSVKKAWQVGGTLAAKNRMKRLRANR